MPNIYCLALNLFLDLDSAPTVQENMRNRIPTDGTSWRNEKLFRRNRQKPTQHSTGIPLKPPEYNSSVSGNTKVGKHSTNGP